MSHGNMSIFIGYVNTATRTGSDGRVALSLAPRESVSGISLESPAGQTVGTRENRGC